MTPRARLKAALESELGRIGACRACVLRYTGVPHGHIAAYVSAAAADADDPAAACCPACLGILQLDPRLDRAPPASSRSTAIPTMTTEVPAPASTHAAPAKQTVRVMRQYLDGMSAGGHALSTFALEVTMPPALAVRQAAVRAHLSDTIGRDGHLGGEEAGEGEPGAEAAGAGGAAAAAAAVSLPSAAEVKDVLRAMLIPALESASTSARHNQDADFRFALLFEHELSETEAAFTAAHEKNNSNGGGGGGVRFQHKKRAPPAHLGVPVMPESPSGLWQVHGRGGAARAFKESVV
jgi:hypothetical protein